MAVSFNSLQGVCWFFSGRTLEISYFRGKGAEYHLPFYLVIFLLTELHCSCKLLQCTSYFRISIETSKPWTYMNICLFILHTGKMQHTAFLFTDSNNTFGVDYSVSFECVNFMLLVKIAFRYCGWFIQGFIETLLLPNSVSNTNTTY